MLKHIHSYIIIAMVSALMATGCGPKPAPPASIMETPEYHYRAGLRYLDAGEVDKALASFERAIALNPDSAPGYIGKGLALGRKGDFKNAVSAMDKAKGLDKGTEPRIGMIRLLSMQRAEGWLKDAEKEFKAASEKDPANGRLCYYMGSAYKTALDFDKAADLYKRVIVINSEFVAEANAEWALVQKIQRAAPGSVVGKQIALIDRIDRADIAALFDQELDLEKLFMKRGTRTVDTAFKAPEEASSTKMTTDQVISMEAATDIKDHPLRSSIETMLKLRVRGLEPGPDHMFGPDRLITKAEFALMLEDILIRVTGDEKLATKYLGATSPFPDVRNDHYAFSAIMTAASRGYLEADKATGEFRPGASVSGADALLAIREFKSQLKF